jgi:hypothetical protein
VRLINRLPSGADQRMVWLRLGSGRDIGAVDRLGFLGSWLFRCENPDYEGWISLEFLGFSRPNRDFSMGYADFWRKKISRALLPLGRRRRDGSRYSYDAEMQHGSSSKPNSFSAFLQSIAVDRNCRFFVELPDGALSADYQ